MMWSDNVKVQETYEVLYEQNAGINPLNAELNPICHFLALLGVHHIFHVSGLRVNIPS